MFIVHFAVKLMLNIKQRSKTNQIINEHLSFQNIIILIFQQVRLF